MSGGRSRLAIETSRIVWIASPTLAMRGVLIYSAATTTPTRGVEKNRKEQQPLPNPFVARLFVYFSWRRLPILISGPPHWRHTRRSG